MGRAAAVKSALQTLEMILLIQHQMVLAAFQGITQQPFAEVL